MARDESVRQRILAIAVEEINAVGPSGLRILTVCEKSGITAPVVYRHFNSREGLIEEAQVERFIGSLRTDIEVFREATAKCSTQEDFRTLCEAIIQTNFDTRRESRWIRINVVGSSYARPALLERLNKEQRATIDGLAQVLADAKSRGLLPFTGDVDSLATWIHSMFFARVFIENEPDDSRLMAWDHLTGTAILGALFNP